MGCLGAARVLLAGVDVVPGHHVHRVELGGRRRTSLRDVPWPSIVGPLRRAWGNNQTEKVRIFDLQA